MEIKQIIENETDYKLEPKELELINEADLESSNKLITNSDRGNLLNELKRSLYECESFYFSVAFINYSGIQLLLDIFKDLEVSGVKGKIITSTYLNFTEPKALGRLKKFSNVDLKIFIANKEKGFHTKAYIFENKDSYKIIIGSSNITQRALKSNIEWNVQIISKKDDCFVSDVIKEYNALWQSTDIVDDMFLEQYENFIKELKKLQKTNNGEFINYKPITPNTMQKRAMENLSRLRAHGEDKALVIAATGTGKTYMSAFDVKNYNPEKLLFIVHREEILRKAKDTFEDLLTNGIKTTGLFTGNTKEESADYLFSTIQTISKHYEDFDKEAFDYIIIDEAHHAASPSYTAILDYFKPKFLLGMTATPERTDNENIFELFNNNVAIEVRLHDALEDELVIPFHYFGITDIESVDLSDVDIDDITEIAKRLRVNERVDFIIDKMNFYGFDGDKCKCIGFCVNKEHAQYMADEFNKKGIKSISLTSDDSVDRREKYIKELEADSEELEVIFTVDIFNEGVDIPSINSVLMLRPTNSPIVFIQQLGRGLRKHESKSFLTVLDFIGNHKKTFLIAIALNGLRYYDKDSLRVAVATDFSNLPGCTHIQMDRISQERILEQLDKENFNSMKYLKEEYLEFKRMNQGRVPYYLLDYIKFDGAPDPIKFIYKEKTYLSFVAKLEKDDSLKKLLLDQDFINVLKTLSSQLPLKRVYEFAIMKYMLNHEETSLDKAKNGILQYVEVVNNDSVKHSFECLNQNYLDSSEKSRMPKLFELKGERLVINDKFKGLLENSTYKKYFEDVINYGIIRYEKEFGGSNYGIPHFKLYEQYQMKDAALLSNFRKIHSSFRGQGLITNEKEYFLFIDLHKDEGIKESINYKDKFKGRKHFQWQTPNRTTIISQQGQNIIKNVEKQINLHLFVRKYNEIDGKTEPFIYIGKGDCLSFQGEKSITVQLELHNEIPLSLYTEFNKKV